MPMNTNYLRDSTQFKENHGLTAAQKIDQSVKWMRQDIKYNVFVLFSIEYMSKKDYQINIVCVIYVLHHIPTFLESGL